MPKTNSQLNVIEDCSHCGVCCMHMGYPAYMLPREKMSEREVESGDSAQEMLDTGWTKKELLDGHPGEEHWHRLPVPLKIEWQEFVDTYERAGTLDGPCFWFDLDTRRCMHHEYRPQVCRDFQTGSKGCREWRSVYRHLLTD